MAKIITENFKTETTNSLFESLGTDNYYVMASQSLTGIEFEGEPTIANTQIEKRDFQRKVIFGNKINKSDARYMFLENPYQAGRVYDAYDDTQDIETLNMIVTVQEDGDRNQNFLVLKCLDNNNGAVSQEIPGTVDSATYTTVQTQDGYLWQYMFTVDRDNIEQYKTGSFFPLPTFNRNGLKYGDENVFIKAQENISRIKIESTYEGQFNQYLFGEATSTSNASDVQTISSVESSPGVKRVVVSTVAKTGRSLYSVDGAYRNMYLKHSSGKLYDIIDSVTTVGSNQLTLFIRTDNIKLGPDEVEDSFVPNEEGPIQCQIVVKINVSPSTIDGERAKAYGVLDQNGTLKKIEFETRGTKYKYAKAEVVYPPLLKNSQSVADNPTVLRAIVSPKGGHGSNPINEMAMSRLSLVTNFDGASNFVPDYNTYSVVGLVKNPVIANTENVGASDSHQFDNRLILKADGNRLDQTGPSLGSGVRLAQGGLINHYVCQYIQTIDIQDAQDGVSYTIVDQGNMTSVDSFDSFQVGTSVGNAVGTVFQFQNKSSLDSSSRAQLSFATTSVDTADSNYDYGLDVISARIHEMKYDADSDKTFIYLVDYYGDFASKFQKGIFYIKEKESSTISINNEIATEIVYGDYEVYSGDLLHYIDFAPITREADKSEKIKFTFDF